MTAWARLWCAGAIIALATECFGGGKTLADADIQGGETTTPTTTSSASSPAPSTTLDLSSAVKVTGDAEAFAQSPSVVLDDVLDPSKGFGVELDADVASSTGQEKEAASTPSTSSSRVTKTCAAAVMDKTEYIARLELAASLDRAFPTRSREITSLPTAELSDISSIKVAAPVPSAKWWGNGVQQSGDACGSGQGPQSKCCKALKLSQLQLQESETNSNLCKDMAVDPLGVAKLIDLPDAFKEMCGKEGCLTKAVKALSEARGQNSRLSPSWSLDSACDQVNALRELYISTCQRGDERSSDGEPTSSDSTDAKDQPRPEFCLAKLPDLSSALSAMLKSDSGENASPFESDDIAQICESPCFYSNLAVLQKSFPPEVSPAQKKLWRAMPPRWKKAALRDMKPGPKKVELRKRLGTEMGNIMGLPPPETSAEDVAAPTAVSVDSSTVVDVHADSWSGTFAQTLRENLGWDLQVNFRSRLRKAATLLCSNVEKNYCYPLLEESDVWKIPKEVSSLGQSEFAEWAQMLPEQCQKLESDANPRRLQQDSADTSSTTSSTTSTTPTTPTTTTTSTTASPGAETPTSGAASDDASGSPATTTPAGAELTTAPTPSPAADTSASSGDGITPATSTPQAIGETTTTKATPSGADGMTTTLAPTAASPTNAPASNPTSTAGDAQMSHSAICQSAQSITETKGCCFALIQHRFNSLFPYRSLSDTIPPMYDLADHCTRLESTCPSVFSSRLVYSKTRMPYATREVLAADASLRRKLDDALRDAVVSKLDCPKCRLTFCVDNKELRTNAVSQKCARASLAVAAGVNGDAQSASSTSPDSSSNPPPARRLEDILQKEPAVDANAGIDVAVVVEGDGSTPIDQSVKIAEENADIAGAGEVAVQTVVENEAVQSGSTADSGAQIQNAIDDAANKLFALETTTTTLVPPDTTKAKDDSPASLPETLSQDTRKCLIESMKERFEFILFRSAGEPNFFTKLAAQPKRNSPPLVQDGACVAAEEKQQVLHEEEKQCCAAAREGVKVLSEAPQCRDYSLPTTLHESVLELSVDSQSLVALCATDGCFHKIRQAIVQTLPEGRGPSFLCGTVQKTLNTMDNLCAVGKAQADVTAQSYVGKGPLCLTQYPEYLEVMTRVAAAEPLGFVTEEEVCQDPCFGALAGLTREIASYSMVANDDRRRLKVQQLGALTSSLCDKLGSTYCYSTGVLLRAKDAKFDALSDFGKCYPQEQRRRLEASAEVQADAKFLTNLAQAEMKSGELGKVVKDVTKSVIDSLLTGKEGVKGKIEKFTRTVLEEATCADVAQQTETLGCCAASFFERYRGKMQQSKAPPRTPPKSSGKSSSDDTSGKSAGDSKKPDAKAAASEATRKPAAETKESGGMRRRAQSSDSQMQQEQSTHTKCKDSLTKCAKLKQPRVWKMKSSIPGFTKEEAKRNPEKGKAIAAAMRARMDAEIMVGCQSCRYTFCMGDWNIEKSGTDAVCTKPESGTEEESASADATEQPAELSPTTSSPSGSQRRRALQSGESSGEITTVVETDDSSERDRSIDIQMAEDSGDADRISEDAYAETSGRATAEATLAQETQDDGSGTAKGGVVLSIDEDPEARGDAHMVSIGTFSIMYSTIALVAFTWSRAGDCHWL